MHRPTPSASSQYGKLRELNRDCNLENIKKAFSEFNVFSFLAFISVVDIFGIGKNSVKKFQAWLYPYSKKSCEKSLKVTKSSVMLFFYLNLTIYR